MHEVTGKAGKARKKTTTMILYVNACVREASRTQRLAQHLLAGMSGHIREVRLLDITFPKMDESFLRRRDDLVAAGAYEDAMFDLARTFAAADAIVIAAPFWDLSFPAALKQYFEQVNVPGITFVYGDNGVPTGLCRAKELYYLTTAGGAIPSEAYGYGYVKALAQGFYGIPHIEMIRAEGLDIDGADVEQIMLAQERRLNQLHRWQDV